MAFNIKTISPFERQFKQLKKKYPSLPDNLLQLTKELEAKPNQGSALGKSCYKVRMAVSSKN